MLCIDDHHLMKEDFEGAGEMAPVWAPFGVTCLLFARRGRPDILCGQVILSQGHSQSGTACGPSLARLMSDIHVKVDLLYRGGNPFP